MNNTVFFVPACGNGTRIAGEGKHKPYIDIRGRMALDRVLDQAPEGVERHAMVRHDMGCPPLEKPVVVWMTGPTKGQADTIRRWVEQADAAERWKWAIISNCDNLIDKANIEACLGQNTVFTFDPRPGDTRWSYVAVRSNGSVHRIAEKEPISERAVAGVYILDTKELWQALRPEDVSLSQALARMKLWAFPVAWYCGWNDAEQLKEVRGGQ